MAAGEHEPQPVVLDVFGSPRRRIVGAAILLGILVERVEPRAPADAVYGLEATGRNQPRPRVGRHAVARPLFECRPESVVQRLFGDIEVAEQADQGGEDAARLRPVDGIYRFAHPFGRVLTHWHPESTKPGNREIVKSGNRLFALTL